MTILDQNSKRMHKVQRFKREREIKSQLAANQMKRMRLHQLQAEVNIQPSSGHVLYIYYLSIRALLC